MDRKAEKTPDYAEWQRHLEF